MELSNSILSGLIRKCQELAENLEDAQATLRRVVVSLDATIRLEMKRAGVTYAELAKRLEGHGLQETEVSINSKLAQGIFTVTFMVAVIASLELEVINIQSLVKSFFFYGFNDA